MSVLIENQNILFTKKTFFFKQLLKPTISINRWVAIVLYQFRFINDECGLDFEKRITYKLTKGKQSTRLTRRTLDETIAIKDHWLKMTGCRIVECKQHRTNDKKVTIPYLTTRRSLSLLFTLRATHACLTRNRKCGAPHSERHLPIAQ